MPRPAPRAYRRPAGLALLAGALILTGGCVRFGGKAPARLLAITAASPAPAGETISASVDKALFVNLPTTPRAIAPLRVAVRNNDNSYAYVKDAVWADTPARQFQAVLAETIRTRAGRLVLDPGQYLARRGQMLEGNLLDFGIDAAAHRAVVTYDASLMSMDGQSLKRQRFSAAVPVNQIDADTVAPAISEAANQVATAVADWVKAQN
ncbi:ABC-type transport auxiliary lipoprotein family protein [Sphingobium nicotianae]|uniref:Membrane integrity-associated transporter subunit PqiC n=1 Tax=Sphingobium nicotianae TaxID=2782607 RepID=A0A9X1ISG2_9SPHN|nr:ABC-type transport auxiliary lipoprotein family protein [Sphingobium nicotianae]MBT2188566.1 membrane integrity-associated transporter subunit PqiC [Sphingobium nicotianae]